MAMECPACGGQTVFDPETQKLKCMYCDSVFDAMKYERKNEAEKHSFQILQNAEQITVDVYNCKHCGAELCAPKGEIVAFCMYCGGQATLLQKGTPIKRPQGIIPFKISKKEVCKKYAESISSIPFVPSIFKNPEFIEGFRGIYIPFWKNSVRLNAPATALDGVVVQNTYRSETRSYYEYKADFSGSVDAGTYDASEAFDDTIASAISPYKKSSIVPFKESYLSGFYADKATVDPKVYGTLIQDQYEDSIKKEIKAQLEGMDTTCENIRKVMPLENVQSESCLFPVWFLTWRHKDRVAYSVMNGESGTLCAEVPVDFKKFFLIAFVVSLILAGALSLVPMFVIPFRVAAYSSILLFLSSFILRNELRNINRIENHAFDYGSLLHKRDSEGRSVVDKKRKPEGKGCSGSGVNALLFLGFFGAVILAMDITLSSDLASVLGIMIVLQLIVFAKQFKEISGVRNKAGLITMILSIAVQFAGFGIVDTNVQDDIYYYGIAVGCLVAMIINIITSIFYTSYLASRPVPNFYTREGANNGR